MRRLIKGFLPLALAASATACLDLSVQNENNPDRRRALSEAVDVEGIIGTSTFRSWYNTLHGLANITFPFGVISDENTATAQVLSKQWSEEPRTAFRNDDLSPQIWSPRHVYDNMSECIAAANDALAQIKAGMVIRTFHQPADTAVTDNTNRAIAWGKLWQGVCAGYMALTLDRFAMATEDTDLPLGWEALSAWEKQHLTESNWEDNLDIAIASLEKSIEVATTTGPWMTLDAWIPGRTYTNAEVAQLAHTMIARLLVYSARYPEDRQTNVDWDKVLFHTERGLTYDFGPVLADGVITDGSYLARLTTTTSTGSSHFRADYRHIGAADQSGNYQAWLTKNPHSEAARFLITTPDRRITGPTPTSNGAYYRYQSSTGPYDATRGLQHQSFYQWHRRANYGGYTSTTGPYALASVDENRLFRAEAFLRKGQLQQAADLINVTRTRAQRIGTTNYPGLPPVTTTGVPEVNGVCVPRKDSGACGSLMDALIYERNIELVGLDPMRAWMDKRGFGTLQQGTFVQLPVPARYLVTLGIPLYTYGGVGGEGAAR